MNKQLIQFLLDSIYERDNKIFSLKQDVHTKNNQLKDAKEHIENLEKDINKLLDS
jgi:cell division protein FtsL